MILIDAGERSEKAFAAKVMFAAQLAARGHAVAIDAATMPEIVDRNLKYEAAPYLADTADIDIARVLVIGGSTIQTETLTTLRGYGLAPDVPVTVIARFSDRQARIGAQSHVAYALGREPGILDLTAAVHQPILASGIQPLVASDSPAATEGEGVPRLLLYLPPEALDDPATLPVMAAMDRLPGIRLSLILSGKCKDLVKGSRYSGLSVFGYSELAPTTFAGRAELAVFFGDCVPGERMAVLALDMMRAGKAVIDCTANAALVMSGAPALRGPEEPAALAAYLRHTVLVNLREIGRQTRASPWIADHAIERLEKALHLAPPEVWVRPGSARPAPARTVFVPTNGNGLGHAQRCTLIAAAKPREAVFAAFPSCVPLIRSRGFPCLPLVQKSEDHPEEYANDLMNYLRLRQVVRRGDRLVFDGGYVFDSIYRVVMETALDAIWIRRGLWRPGQANSVALDREKAFARVIAPQEAFEELNTDYSVGPQVRRVGPVVQRAGRGDPGILRGRISELFGLEFDELVVTMLGGGVAADRSAQIQTLCNLAERRTSCLHLVVVWPNSRVAPGAFGWRNTRVVQTRNALALAMAADLVVSAAGYNSFHEILYHGIPAIFVPQMAAFMDDQERRARAASDRGLTVTVAATELLMLEREMRSCLEDGKAGVLRSALTKAVLPETGTAEAARIIGEGVCA